jgi:hypothetical protein
MSDLCKQMRAMDDANAAAAATIIEEQDRRIAEQNEVLRKVKAMVWRWHMEGWPEAASALDEVLRGEVRR